MEQIILLQLKILYLPNEHSFLPTNSESKATNGCHTGVREVTFSCYNDRFLINSRQLPPSESSGDKKTAGLLTEYESRSMAGPPE